MDIKITYTCINTYSSSTSHNISTYYDTTIQDAMEKLKVAETESLKIQKIEVINQ